MASRITQEVLEVVLAPPGAKARVTQDAVEAVIGAAAPVANVRITQETAEVVVGTNARVTQDVIEAVIAPPEPNVRVTQEVLEVILAPPGANARVSQEVVEVVLTALPPEEASEFLVRAIPLVRWGKHGLGGDDDDGIIAADPNHPRGGFAVNSHPRIAWGGTENDPYNRFFVQCRPKVAYVTGPGTASTECISATGIVPPPAEEPPESLEQNYVF